MSSTAKTYKRLFDGGRVDAEGLQRAVARGLITADEYSEIAGKMNLQG